jgi:DNA-directed RNA polymerase subunit F
LALTITRADYPRGGAIEILAITQFDPALRHVEKVVEFEPNQVSAALEELDSMHRVLRHEATDASRTDPAE